MTLSVLQKLRLIRQFLGLSQVALAQKLGVSFVSVNRWMRGKATPRRGATEHIDALYREVTGLREVPADALHAKKAALKLKARGTTDVLETISLNPDIHDQFVLTLTYTSNRIEGSTLTEAETAEILFDNRALPNRTLTEQLEAKNHQAALEYLFRNLQGNGAIDEGLILRLHGMLLNGIRDDAGAYRRHAVRIVGADVPTANHAKVPALMGALCAKISRTRAKDVIERVGQVHSSFEQIHPFADGNGRTGRLLMDTMLLKENYPPAVIKQDQRRAYMTALHAAQRRGDDSLLEDFLCDTVLEGWKIIERD